MRKYDLRFLFLPNGPSVYVFYDTGLSRVTFAIIREVFKKDENFMFLWGVHGYGEYPGYSPNCISFGGFESHTRNAATINTQTTTHNILRHGGILWKASSSNRMSDRWAQTNAFSADGVAMDRELEEKKDPVSDSKTTYQNSIYNRVLYENLPW